MIYWDTSVILKLYAEEADSSDWQATAIAQVAPLRTSALSYSEMAYALKQKEVRGEIAVGSARELFGCFKNDLEAGRVFLVPMGRDVLDDASILALETETLRTLDGLHLATARLAKCSEIATSDQRLARAAESVGLGVCQI